MLHILHHKLALVSISFVLVDAGRRVLGPKLNPPACCHRLVELIFLLLGYGSTPKENPPVVGLASSFLFDVEDAAPKLNPPVGT
jgi:hypothetical protein